MSALKRNPSMRQGQFLWMEENSREKYVTNLKDKIDKGFYFTEQVISKIVEEIAPVLNESAEL